MRLVWLPYDLAAAALQWALDQAFGESVREMTRRYERQEEQECDAA